jgi:hypothetical protein
MKTNAFATNHARNDAPPMQAITEILPPSEAMKPILPLLAAMPAFLVSCQTDSAGYAGNNPRSPAGAYERPGFRYGRSGDYSGGGMANYQPPVKPAETPARRTPHPATPFRHSDPLELEGPRKPPELRQDLPIPGARRATMTASLRWDEAPETVRMLQKSQIARAALMPRKMAHL